MSHTEIVMNQHISFAVGWFFSLLPRLSRSTDAILTTTGNAGKVSTIKIL